MSEKPKPTDQDVKTLVDLAIDEDGRDLTSEWIFSSNSPRTAEIRAQAMGRLCGVEMAVAVFHKVDPRVDCRIVKNDGTDIKNGDVILTISGPVLSLLRAERPALNFLQHLSGIATLTAAFVKAVHGTGTTILDTRKTLPGWRRLQKYAVRMGGGENHRLRLDAMLLVKDNHITAAGGITAAVQKIKSHDGTIPLEVEAATLEDVKELLELGVDRIMLDNFSVADVKRAVALCKGKVPLEVSGGLTLETVRAFAEAGVEFASIGRLTHSVSALEMHMELVDNNAV